MAPRGAKWRRPAPSDAHAAIGQQAVPHHIGACRRTQPGDGLGDLVGIGGAADGRGSTGDLAASLGLSVILVVDAEKQSQSIAPLVSGFVSWRPNVRVAGVILNRVATTRHERMLRDALAETAVPVLGALPRRDALK